MTETPFPRYKTSGNCTVLFLPQSVLCLTSVLCLKRGGGVLIGLRRIAESKEEEEVVMVMMMMKKMWDLGCSIR